MARGETAAGAGLAAWVQAAGGGDVATEVFV